jgi:hypothetical protein
MVVDKRQILALMILATATFYVLSELEFIDLAIIPGGGPYMYAVILENGGEIVQIDTSINEVVDYISVPTGRPHVIASDGEDNGENGYVFVGTLDSPLQLYKVKVPELMIVDQLDMRLYEDPALNINGIFHLTYYNGFVYASTNGCYCVVEVNADTMQVTRKGDITLNGPRTSGGVEYYNGYLYYQIMYSGAVYMARMNYNSFIQESYIEMPISGISGQGIREIRPANDYIYGITGGSGATRIFQVDPVTFTLITWIDTDGIASDRLIYDGYRYLYINHDQTPTRISRIDISGATIQPSTLYLSTDKIRGFDVDLNSDGSILYVVNAISEEITIIDTNTFMDIGTIPLNIYGMPVQMVIPSTSAPARMPDPPATTTTSTSTTTTTTSTSTTSTITSTFTTSSTTTIIINGTTSTFTTTYQTSTTYTTTYSTTADDGLPPEECFYCYYIGLFQDNIYVQATTASIGILIVYVAWRRNGKS